MSYEQIAAVDLGSNSFRLEVGRVVDEHIYSLDSLKESIRLASGLDSQNNLDEASQIRALDTLRRFGERLRDLPKGAVRAVATNTLRVAKNAADFIPRAEEALGFPIEVIRGLEEARLIYIGVTHSLPLVTHKRLVIDIGGGSTECIIGQSIDPLLMESLYMGCVSYSQRFFPGGLVTKKNFAQAEISAAREIEKISANYKKLGWDEVVASSGTAKALADLFESNKMNPENSYGISREAMVKLRDKLVASGSADKLKLHNLPEDRLPVFAGGIAIMSAVFDSFNIEKISYGEGALRLGVLYDLLGRFHRHDMRDITVQQFSTRYQIDQKQASRVEKMALNILGQLIGENDAQYESEAQFLRWACALHEIGISVSRNGFNKHGAYIVSFADMPGFSKKDQERLAKILLVQRGKLEKISAIAMSDPLWKLVLCLRLASLFYRSRDDQSAPVISIKSLKDGFVLDLFTDWLNSNPLSAARLVDESLVWKNKGFLLNIKRRKTAEVTPVIDGVRK